MYIFLWTISYSLTIPDVFRSLFYFGCFWVFQDLPALFLQGGSIIPVGPPYQHVGESDPSDDLTLLVALDENGIFMHSIFSVNE